MTSGDLWQSQRFCFIIIYWQTLQAGGAAGTGSEDRHAEHLLSSAPAPTAPAPTVATSNVGSSPHSAARAWLTPGPGSRFARAPWAPGHAP